MEKQYNLDSCFYALLEFPTFQKRNNNDTLLILGKGHEDYQIIGKEKIHLDDVEEVLNYKSN